MTGYFGGVRPPDSSAPPMILLTAVVCVLVQVAWLTRAAYLPQLTDLVSDIGTMLGIY